MRKDSTNIKRKTIILHSTKKFVKDGIINTSIDTIVKEMKISKKTVYKYFKNKDELVFHILCDLIEQSKKDITIILKRNTNNYYRFIYLMDYITYGYLKHQKYFLHDLYIKYPNLYNDKYLPFKNELKLILIRTIKKCQSQRLFIKFPPYLFVNSYFLLLRRFFGKESEEEMHENMDIINAISFMYVNGLLNCRCKLKYHKIAEENFLII